MTYFCHLPFTFELNYMISSSNHKFEKQFLSKSNLAFSSFWKPEMVTLGALIQRHPPTGELGALDNHLKFENSLRLSGPQGLNLGPWISLRMRLIQTCSSYPEGHFRGNQQLDRRISLLPLTQIGWWIIMDKNDWNVLPESNSMVYTPELSNSDTFKIKESSIYLFSW